MRLQPAGIESRATSASGAVAAPQGVGAPSAPVAKAPPPVGEGNGRYAGFVARQAQINQQATGRQQALAYLDALLPKLRELARRLGIAPSGAAPAALQESLQQLRQHWQQRAGASAGLLDNGLQLVAPGKAQQAFTLRGLDQASLAEGGAETLVFHPRGLGRPARVLALDEAGGLQDRLVRLQAALAPAGIAVATREHGALVFSTNESAWPELREQLLVQGGGRRFPSGRPGRLAPEPLPAEVEPQNWQIDAPTQRQQSFRQVSAALIRGERSHAQLSGQLAAAAGEVYAGREPASPARAGALVGEFAEGLAQDAGFRRLATAGACLRGMSRQRVGSVLGN